MKIKFLAVGFLGLFVLDMQASSLREIVAQNPASCAAIGYAVGAIGYQALRGCSLNPLVVYEEIHLERRFDIAEGRVDSAQRRFDLAGLQLMGLSGYVYLDIHPSLPDKDQLHNAAQTKIEKKSTLINRKSALICSLHSKLLNPDEVEKGIVMEEIFTNKTDKSPETVKRFVRAYSYLDKDSRMKINQDEDYDIARFTKTKACRYQEDHPLRCRAEVRSEYPGGKDKFGYAVILDEKPVIIGLVSSAVFYGLSLLAEQK